VLFAEYLQPPGKRHNPRKTPISEKSAGESVVYTFVQSSANFPEIGIFLGICRFVAISARFQALGLPPRICAPQIPGLRNQGKLVSEGWNSEL